MTILRLINHAKYLRDKQENQLCIKLLQIFKEMIPNEDDEAQELRKYLLKKYIEEDPPESESSFLNKKSPNNKTVAIKTSEMNGIGGSSSNSFNIKDEEEENEIDRLRYEIQCELNDQGASDLVVDLFMSDSSNKIFKETVLLAIALLEGGNTQVQVFISH